MRSLTEDTRHMTYSNLDAVSDEIRAIIDDNQDHYQLETTLAHEDILKLCLELSHKLKCVDRLEDGVYDEVEFLQELDKDSE